MYVFWLVVCCILLSKNISSAKYSAKQLYDIDAWSNQVAQANTISNDFEDNTVLLNKN